MEKKAHQMEEEKYKNPVFKACKQSLEETSPLLEKVYKARQKARDHEEKLLKHYWGVQKEMAEEIFARDLGLTLEEEAFLRIGVKFGKTRITLLQELIRRDKQVPGFTITFDRYKRIRLKSFYIAVGYGVKVRPFLENLNKKLEGLISIRCAGFSGSGDSQTVVFSLFFDEDKSFPY